MAGAPKPQIAFKSWAIVMSIVSTVTCQFYLSALCQNTQPHGCPAGQAQVYLFQNWNLLQRPPDSCLTALRKFAWQNFSLEVEVSLLVHVVTLHITTCLSVLPACLP